MDLKEWEKRCVCIELIIFIIRLVWEIQLGEDKLLLELINWQTIGKIGWNKVELESRQLAIKNGLE